MNLLRNPRPKRHWSKKWSRTCTQPIVFAVSHRWIFRCYTHALRCSKIVTSNSCLSRNRCTGQTDHGNTVDRTHLTREFVHASLICAHHTAWLKMNSECVCVCHQVAPFKNKTLHLFVRPCRLIACRTILPHPCTLQSHLPGPHLEPHPRAQDRRTIIPAGRPKTLSQVMSPTCPTSLKTTRA